MTYDEIMAKAKYFYEHVSEINTMEEARQAVRDAASMIFYLAKNAKQGTRPEHDDEKGD
jgi:hypothetical protein